MVVGVRSGPSRSPRDVGFRAWPSNVVPLAIYHGYGNVNAEDTLSMDRMLGKTVPWGHGFLDQTSFANLASSVGLVGSGSGGAIASHKRMGRSNVVVSVPLATNTAGQALSDVAAGTWDAAFTAAAQNILALGYPAPVIRIGWEFNLGPVYWAWGVNDATSSTNYKAAFRRAVLNSFRVVMPDCKICWCINPGVGAYDPVLSYPGDDVVDYIGIDAYDTSQHAATAGADGVNASIRWTRDVVGSLASTDDGTTAPYGLAWLASFGASHSKGICIPEWGCVYQPGNANHNCADDPTYITNMLNWIVANNVVFHGYFESNSTPTSLNYSLSRSTNIVGVAPFYPLDNKPNSAAAFKAFYDQY